jgi:hypothetical protein
MKLRIRGNSIRLRLTKSDVETFAADGRVEDSIDFGDGKAKFTYALENSDRAQSFAEFDGATITVFVPRGAAREWIGSDQVGIEADPTSGPRILIEMDFACLHERPGEPDDDAFANTARTTANRSE